MDRQPLPAVLNNLIDNALKQQMADGICSNLEKEKENLIELRRALSKKNYSEEKFRNWFLFLDGYTRTNVPFELDTANCLLSPEAMRHIPSVIKMIDDCSDHGKVPSLPDDNNLDAENSPLPSSPSDEQGLNVPPKNGVGRGGTGDAALGLGIPENDGAVVKSGQADEVAAGNGPSENQGSKNLANPETKAPLGRRYTADGRRLVSTRLSKAPQTFVPGTSQFEKGNTSTNLGGDNGTANLQRAQQENHQQEPGSAPSARRVYVFNYGVQQRRRGRRNPDEPIVDGQIVLSNAYMMDQINGNKLDKLASKRKKLPRNTLEMWKYNRIFRQKDLFSQPLVHGLIENGVGRAPDLPRNENDDEERAPDDEVTAGNDDSGNLGDKNQVNPGTEITRENDEPLAISKTKAAPELGTTQSQQRNTSACPEADRGTKEVLKEVNQQIRAPKESFLEQIVKQKDTYATKDSEDTPNAIEVVENMKESSSGDDDDDDIISTPEEFSHLSKESLLFDAVGKWLEAKEYQFICENPNKFTNMEDVVDGGSDITEVVTNEFLLGIVLVPTEVADHVGGAWKMLSKDPTSCEIPGDGFNDLACDYFERLTPVGLLKRRIYSSVDSRTAIMHTRLFVSKATGRKTLLDEIDDVRVKACSLIDDLLGPIK